MSFSFSIRKNDVSPKLSRLAATAQRPQAVLRAMGTTFKSITEGTFNSVGASYRPAPWAVKYDGSPSILQKSTTMAKSFQLEVTDQYAKVSNPMVYASIHQFGGEILAKGKALSWIGPDGKRIFAKRVKIPARPFFPVLGGKLTGMAEEKIRRAGERVIARQVGV